MNLYNYTDDSLFKGKIHKWVIEGCGGECLEVSKIL